MSCGKWESKITVPTGDWTATLKEYVPAAVTWIDETNCTATGNDLIKDAGGSGWNAYAHHSAQLAADGYAEFTIVETNAYRLFGLATTAATGPAAINFGIETDLAGEVVVKELDVEKARTTYAPSDVFRVQRIGAAVSFWKNGAFWYTSITSSTGSLYVCAAMYTVGATIADAVVADTGAGSTITLTAAKTYYHSSAGNDTLDLPARLMALLDAAGAATYAVSVDAVEGGTGRYTISASGGSVTAFSLTWISTALRDLLGFPGHLAIAAGPLTYVSPGAAEGLWIPDGAPLSLTSIGDEIDESDHTVLESPTGVYVHRLAYHRKRVITDLRYPHISRARARIVGETYVNESWQQFWRDVIDGDASAYLQVGQARIYPDAGDDATYYDYWLCAGTEECRPIALREGWQGRFTITCPRLVRVET